MFKDLKLVIFDMDGLMFNTERVLIDERLDHFKRLNMNVDESVLYQTLGTTSFDLNTIIKGDIPEGVSIASIFEETSEKVIKDLSTNGVPKKPGLDELMDFLDSKNIPMAIASSTHSKRAMLFLKKEDLLSRFKVIVCGDDVERVKPYPDVFLKTCELTNTNINQALVLEDSKNGAIAAYKAGIKCVIVPDIVEPDEEVKEIAYCIVDSLKDVIALF